MLFYSQEQAPNVPDKTPEGEDLSLELPDVPPEKNQGEMVLIIKDLIVELLLFTPRLHDVQWYAVIPRVKSALFFTRVASLQQRGAVSARAQSKWPFFIYRTVEMQPTFCVIYSLFQYIFHSPHFVLFIVYSSIFSSRYHIIFVLRDWKCRRN